MTDDDFPVPGNETTRTKRSVEEVFDVYRGRAIFLEDPDTPTESEWSTAQSGASAYSDARLKPWGAVSEHSMKLIEATL